jgi:mitogen-activated protein kinase 7
MQLVLLINPALDLLNGLLAFDPASRIDASAALAHGYLAAYHIPEDEPSHPKLFDFAFETTNTIPEIKRTSS